MKTNYQKLITLRNERLYPDGVPLEFGCEVEIGKYSRKGKEIVTTKQYYVIEHAKTHDDGDRVYSDKEFFYAKDKRFFNNRSLAYLYEGKKLIRLKDNDDGYYKTLGKDVSLRGVLEMLEPTEKIFFEKDISGIQFLCIDGINLPLTEDPKDYPEELLEQLIEILQ